MSVGSKASTAAAAEGGNDGKKTRKIRARIRMWARRRIICLTPPDDGAGRGACVFLRGAARAQAKENCDFSTWMTSQGHANDTVRIGISPHGRALFAIRPILKGERMLQVSKDLIITPAKLPEEVSRFLSGNVTNWAKIALFVLLQQRAGKESAWAPYIRCLPRLGHSHSTIFWKTEELAYLERSPLYHETIERMTVINYEYAAVQKAIVRCVHLFDRVSLPEFKHAYATVCSRAWGLERAKSLALVPFIDFFNHDASCRTLLSFDEEKSVAEVIADRDYAVGEQVIISYGQLSNATLALDFGFAVPYNPHDEAEIFIFIPKHDPLHDSKIQLLHSHSMETMGETSGSRFIIQEVKSPTGRGKGIPQAVRAFARVICATSSEELDEMAKTAAATDGRLARQASADKAKELQAMKILAALVDNEIKEHTRATLALKNSKLTPSRRGIARAVLGGETRVLRSASAWFTEHMKTLL